MLELFDQLGWAIIVLLPVVSITLCVVVVAVAALVARRPDTRRHCLTVLMHLTRYVSVVRGRR